LSKLIFREHRLLFLVLLIEGASLMAVELTGARLVAPFYGNSLYVWTAILLFSVSGLALGYYSGGILTKKLPVRETLFSVLGLSALLVFLLPYSAKAFISLTSGMDLLAGVILTGFALMVPPMLCFGMVGPLVVRWMTSDTESTGKVAGTAYFTSTMGGILATFLFGLFLIPIAGLKCCTHLVALSLAFLPLLNFLMNLVKKDMHSSLPPLEINKVTLPDKKTKKAAIPKIKQGATLYLFAVIEGATVMAVELISARMLAPWFGSSLHVWAVVLGITLLGLATGYYTGGRLANKYPDRHSLMIVLLGASFFIMIMHLVPEWIPMLFSNFSPVISLIINSLLLVLPPLLMLGMIPTMLIGYITSKIDDSGLITGRVFTVSSFSGILAIPLFGFWIIPRFGLTLPTVITGILTGLIPFIQLVRQKTLFGWIFLPLAIFSLLMTREVKNIPGIDVPYYSEGLLGQVMVADVNGDLASPEGKNIKGRMLFVNRMGQSQVDLTTGASRWNYLIFSSAISSTLPEKSSALVLGLGGGMMAEKLNSELGFTVDAVELDSRIAHIAHQYFGLDEKVHVFVDDARHYMETTKMKYDLIYFDVFRGEVQPAHVLSLEAFKKAGTLLNHSGLIIVNFNGYLDGKIGLPGRSVFATLQAAGFETRILPTPGEEESRNSLFIASKQAMTFDHLRTPLAYFGKEVKIDSLFLNPGTINLDDAIILTDNKPVLEWLNIKATASWRKDYTLTFTELFSKNGVPLFK
jgi:predicted membrane-bound spermidine synthase